MTAIFIGLGILGLIALICFFYHWAKSVNNDAPEKLPKKKFWLNSKVFYFKEVERIN